MPDLDGIGAFGSIMLHVDPDNQMHGIDISKRYFFEAALPLLKEKYPYLLERIAAGLVAGGFDSGCGSEIGGFDDELSRDHNWGPRFFLFMHPADKREIGNEIQNYLDSSLPSEFSGFKSTATTLPQIQLRVEAAPRAGVGGFDIQKKK